MGAAVLSGPARAEAVAVLANMTAAALGGGDERRGEDHQGSPRAAGGGLPAPVVDGAGPPAHRVHDAPVRAGRGSGPARLGTGGCEGDRHRPGHLRPVGGGPGRLCRAGEAGLPGRGRRDLRDRDLPAGPLERRRGPADGVRPDHQHPADRRRRCLRPCRRQRPDAARPEGHHGRGGAAPDGRPLAAGQAGRGRAWRAAHPAAGRLRPRRAWRCAHRPRCRGAGRDP